MTFLLLGLAVPLCVPPGMWGVRRGLAFARIVATGLALAAIWQATGTLDPFELRRLGADDAAIASLVSFASAMAFVSSAAIPRRGVPVLVTALAWPLTVGLAVTIDWSSVLAIGAGAAFGAAPAITAALLDRRPVRPASWSPEPAPGPAESCALVLLLIASAQQASIAVALAAAGALAWWAWLLRRHAVRWQRVPLVPLLVMLSFATAGWLALTVAGDVGAPVRSFNDLAPLSPAAEVLLALVLLAGVVILATPWPLDAFPRSTIPVIAAIFIARAAREIVPAGVDHWLPLVTAIAVLSAIAALLRRRPLVAGASVALLGATRAGDAPMAAALAIAVATAVIAIRGSRYRQSPLIGHPMVGGVAVIGAALACVVVTRGVLADEIVWAVVLALALAAAGHAHDAAAATPTEVIRSRR